MEHVLQKYQTRPVNSRGRTRKLRYNFSGDNISAGEKGKHASPCGTFWLGSFLAGIDDVLHLGGEIYGAFRGSHLTFTQRPDDVIEVRRYSGGFYTHIRGYFNSFSVRCHLNSFLPFIGFVSRSHICDSLFKWFHIVPAQFSFNFFDDHRALFSNVRSFDMSG